MGGVIEGERSQGRVGKQAVDGRGGPKRGKRREKELVGEERFEERRKIDEACDGCNSGGEVGVRVFKTEEWVKIYEQYDAFCL